MNWWGKLIGGAFGFMLGGPLGALLGAALGHNFDKGISGIMLDPEMAQGNAERVQTAFFTATFSVMGYIAKADGRVSQSEINLARDVMRQMQLREEQATAAMHLFNEGKQPDFPLTDVLLQFRKECQRRTNLIQMFLEIQIATAMADGKIDANEHSVLFEIADALGFPRQAFEQLLSMVQAQQHYAGGGAQPAASMEDAYTVLGIKKSATDAEVKKAYRRLTNQHHPDKLVSKGLPEEMIEIAKTKTQEIRAAYDQIKQSRGMK
ncbi:MAG TPA: co-chaperone DjlA [Gammaproteobacteria bacterium]|nr:co-chaperone DjlA [Gammaproteobacteria bacterium]